MNPNASGIREVSCLRARDFSVLVSTFFYTTFGEGENSLSEYKSFILTRVPYSFNFGNELKSKILGELEIIQTR